MSPTAPEVITSEHLDPQVQHEVAALVRKCAAHDGVIPLSEAFALALATPGCHIWAEAGEGAVGYAAVAPDGTCELLVDPDRRGRGLGSLLAGAAQERGARRFWAHGDLAPARMAARSLGLAPVRSLHVLETRLDAPAADPVFPPGFVVRTFADDPSVESLHRLNAAAFASHPEQGALSVSDLEHRLAQPWVEADGLFWVFDSAAGAPDDPIAFHWTKVEDAATGVGEVYVVGVHPSYQGRGLARPLTRLGTDHLARRGLNRARLYVDGDNAAAMATYLKEGFEIVGTDVMYAVGAGTL